jgi:hypothetical protein
MAKRTPYLITYDTGTYATIAKAKPYHWSFLIQKDQGGQNLGIAHQLRGIPGTTIYE